MVRQAAPMTPLLAAALELQTFFDQRQWRFCIIGGIALLRWGEPRFTRDVDVSLLAGFGREEEFIAPILASPYRGRIPDAAEFARRSRVLLLDSPDGVPIDVALAGLPFEALMVERASIYEFETGCSLKTCSAEDLVVQKLFAFRTRDVADVEGIVLRQRGRLDWAYVETQLTPLVELKEQPEIMEVFRRLRQA
jgi:nucleotidyltransferase AbiEii toxin of type IV toxin-antitoxin system